MDYRRGALMKRIEWIDALKGYGIILVTFAHLNPWFPLETFIYSFHMCLFFFISGYLFKPIDTVKDFVKKKAKNLLIPFTIWNALSTIIAIASGSEIKESILRFFVYKGMLCWNAPIWFLLVLFFCEILYGLSKIRNIKFISILVILISGSLWLLCDKKPITLLINLVPMALFFYGMGDISRQYFEKHTFKNIISIIFGLIIISVVFGVVLNSRVSYTSGEFGNAGCFIIAAISGTMAHFLLFKNCIIKFNNIILNLGNNSLIIMASQYWLFKVFDIVSKKFLGISLWFDRGTIKAAIMTIITISSIMMFIYVYKKIFANNNKMLKFAKWLGVR